MQVVKLAHAREAAFQHLDICLGGDRFHVLRGETIQKMIHDLAPGPERVCAGRAHLRQAGHPALESVRVQIGQPGNGHRSLLIAGLRRRVGLDGGNDAVANGQPDVFIPAAGQERRLEPETVPNGRLAGLIFTGDLHRSRA